MSPSCKNSGLLAYTVDRFCGNLELGLVQTNAGAKDSKSQSLLDVFEEGKAREKQKKETIFERENQLLGSKRVIGLQKNERKCSWKVELLDFSEEDRKTIRANFEQSFLDNSEDLDSSWRRRPKMKRKKLRQSGQETRICLKKMPEDVFFISPKAEDSRERVDAEGTGERADLPAKEDADVAEMRSLKLPVFMDADEAGESFKNEENNSQKLFFSKSFQREKVGTPLQFFFENQRLGENSSPIPLIVERDNFDVFRRSNLGGERRSYAKEKARSNDFRRKKEGRNECKDGESKLWSLAMIIVLSEPMDGTAEAIVKRQDVADQLTGLAETEVRKNPKKWKSQARKNRSQKTRRTLIQKFPIEIKGKC
jgi:hypothetical protein